MKITFVAFSILIAALLVNDVFSITPELDAKAKAAKEKCKNESKRDDVLKKDCSAACWMREMGYMTEGKINLKNMEEANKQKWDNQTMIDLGIYVDTTCTKEVGDGAGLEACGFAYRFGECKHRLVKQTGLQKPTPLKEK